MLCEKCKNSEATIHLTEILKNVKSEIHLCDNCASEMGLNSNVSNFSLSVSDIHSLIGYSDTDNKSDFKVCGGCGTALMDFYKNNNMGCADCYKNFAHILDPILVKQQSSSVHSGKVPVNFVDEGDKLYGEESFESLDLTQDDPGVFILYKKLDEAVLEERYEEAALLRDKIKEKEKISKRG